MCFQKIPNYDKGELLFQLVLWEAASKAMKLKYVGYPVKRSLVLKLFTKKTIDVLLVTFRPKTFEEFLKPFAKAE